MLPIIVALNEFMWRARNDEEGAAAVEYAIIVGLIALGITTGARALGTGIDTLFSDIATEVGTILTGGAE
jgi:pilus assembly protein Flp/PilA